jgi:hypothetical protein
MASRKNAEIFWLSYTCCLYSIAHIPGGLGVGAIIRSDFERRLTERVRGAAPPSVINAANTTCAPKPPQSSGHLCWKNKSMGQGVRIIKRSLLPLEMSATRANRTNPERTRTGSAQKERRPVDWTLISMDRNRESWRSRHHSRFDCFPTRRHPPVQAPVVLAIVTVDTWSSNRTARPVAIVRHRAAATDHQSERWAIAPSPSDLMIDLHVQSAPGAALPRRVGSELSDHSVPRVIAGWLGAV